MTAFMLIAALLAAGALLFVVPPLVSRREVADSTRGAANLAVYRDQARELDADLAAGRVGAAQHEAARRELEARLIADVAGGQTASRAPSRGRTAAIAAGLAIPLGALALYLVVGHPQAIAYRAGDERAAHALSARQVDALIERLAARMKDNPGDPDGWVLLGRSYGARGRFGDAARAYGNAAALRPRDAGLLADYADVLAMAQGRRLRGEPEAIIARALDADPGNLKALALAGSAAFEKKEYAEAARYWERILPLLPPESESARGVQANIDEARSLAGDGRAEPPRRAGAGVGARGG